MALEILDTRTFERFCKILKEKTERHIDIINQECYLLVKNIQSNDIDAVIFSAHKLKSSTGQIGAKALAHYLKDIEERAIACQNVEKKGIDLLNEFDQLESMILETHNALDAAYKISKS